ncbi:bifunctional glutamate--cysteine ligase GshA/glutathione synthetase GshB [Mesobacillus zeae]|uniref:Glutathione biosynthesis bifunctional protein GshAB n=1 Tax=Mesobacillus zeae TaxID=1917180 RepID=A0A398AVG7_9BACI|nr:bifunctional glutamate--cysteine ligase GshA/glutathione synthetase GshB [Mesobacillus zeae]RID81631.1 bifunctional glutamate--cysteine ligase GshA/glutathione synthetase GshB [Mesobacillus zeae]
MNEEFLQLIIDKNLNEDILLGIFGLEKENARVDKDGKLALTRHPKAFGSKIENPYIKTDFSESQIEMITPALDSIDEAYHFLETIQDIVTLELSDEEYLWPSSNPPALPEEEEIPIAIMNDPIEDQYRFKLAEKYGRKRQLISGLHYNFSFNETFLNRLYKELEYTTSYVEFKNDIYLKVARNILKYRWLLIFLTGASPVFNKTYLEKCVESGDHFDEESYFFPNMNSLRNSGCGYRNDKPFYVSFNSIEEYVHDLQSLIESKDLLSVKEFYSPVRVKPARRNDYLQELLQNGIAYLELRMIDLNPLYKNGISKETMQFIHLFLVFMLLKHDESFGEEEQKVATLNHDTLSKEGIKGMLHDEDNRFVSMEEKALEFIGEMEKMVQVLKPYDKQLFTLLEIQKRKIRRPELNFAAIVKSEIQQSSYLTYHMDKAKQYAKESLENGYLFIGFEDLELSTQILLKAAIKRGLEFEFIDRDENFIVLKKGDHTEYVKQATKTSLDSYSTVLIMENKVVTKKVLKQHGIRVPDGQAYRNLREAMADFEIYQEKSIVIKPKSTNFGLGITIFTSSFSKEDYQKAFKMAFEHDDTVLLEEFMTGKEYRFLVMGDEVVGILHRVPANVVGDGIHTIDQLVHNKNKDPLRGQGYKTPLERIRLGEVEEMFLKNQSKSRIDIPPAGEVVYLRENSNISTGGDSIDFTDDIPTSYKNIAIKSAKAAGATICGVDMMIDNIEKEAMETNYSIIEINFNPAIHIHCYPYKGNNRKADERILDLLFGRIK